MPKFGVVQVVRPSFDAATEFGHYFLGLAAQYAAERMIVQDLAAAEATKSNILASLAQDDPIFCYWNGHGNADTFTVQNKEVVMTTGNGDEVLIGRIVLLLSCSVGIRLAPSAVSKGAAAIFAWVMDFSWVATGDPETDVYALGFFEPVNAISNALVDGKTTEEAMTLSRLSWNQWIDYWMASDDPFASLVLQHMIADRDGQILLGSTTARIKKPGAGGIGLLAILWLIVEGVK